MANISLKDIQFPGLNNVYKVPEVDSTLTQSGAAADAKKTGDELSDLKQEYNQMPLNTINPHIDVEYLHEGIIVRTCIPSVEHYYVCVLAQWDHFYLVNGAQNAKIAIQFSRPIDKCDNDRVKFVYFTANNQTEPFLLTPENSSRGTSTVANGRSAVATCPNFSINQNIATPFKMFRPAIELYDENGTLDKILYGRQVNYELVSTNPFKVNVTTMIEENDDEHFIYDGFLHNEIYNFLTPEYENGFPMNFNDNRFQLLNMIEGSINGNYTLFYAFIRYDELHANKNVYQLYPVFVVGKHAVTGNVVRIDIPSMTAKAAITSGQTFCLDGLWYTATADIAKDATVVLDTNAEVCEMPIFD